MVKKITGTRSSIEVEFNDRLIWVEGELTLTPEFYAVKETMKNLTNPEKSLSKEEKDKIVIEILKYNANQPLKIIFED